MTAVIIFLFHLKSTKYAHSYSYNYSLISNKGVNDVKEKNLDIQWLLLILEAKKIGLTLKEVRYFLNTNSYHNSLKQKN